MKVFETREYISNDNSTSNMYQYIIQPYNSELEIDNYNNLKLNILGDSSYLKEFLKKELPSILITTVNIEMIGDFYFDRP